MILNLFKNRYTSTSTVTGYTYDDMVTGNSMNLDFLHLYREFSYSGDQDFDAKITGFDFYIDVDLGIPTCKDCPLFDAMVKNFTTTLHLTVDLTNGNPLPNMFERGVGADSHRMLWTFSQQDLYNLMTNPFPTGVACSLYNWTAADINFDALQQYRVRTRYAVCGNLHDPDWNVVPSDVMKEADITNYMFLKGIPYDFSDVDNIGDITSLQMPNDCNNLALPQFNFCLQPPCTNPPPACTVADQSNFANVYNFYCEPSGAAHYFNSTDMINHTTYHRDDTGPDCKAYIRVNSVNSFKRLTAASANGQSFHYEFKQPRLFPSNFQIEPPSGWSFFPSQSTAQIDLTSFNEFNWGTNYINPTPVSSSTSGTGLSINLNNYQFDCLTAGTPTYSFISDELSSQRLRIWLFREDCDGVVPPVLPYYDQDDSEITFSYNQENCSLPYANCGLSFTQNNMSENNYIYPQSPSLSGTIYPAVFTANTSSVSWDFEILNVASANNLTPTPAKNVYITFPAFNSLYSWQIEYDRRQNDPFNSYPIIQSYTNTPLSSGNYFWLNPTNAPDPIHFSLPVNEFYKGTITASYDCDTPPPTFDFTWGWNCKQVVDEIGYVDLCQEVAVPVSIKNPEGSLAAYNHLYNPPNYTACSTSPIEVTAFFQNLNSVEVHPQGLTITLNSNINIANIVLLDCAGQPHLDYTLQLVSGYTYQIVDPLPKNLMGMDDCLAIRFEMDVDCNVGLLQMPVVTINGFDICETAFDAIFTLPFMSPDTQIPTLCDDCYSITKSAYQSSVQVGDPVTFVIDICANNLLPSTVSLDDLLPQYFTAIPALTFPMSINVPAIGCVLPMTQITGVYTQESSCTDPDNVNIATITYGANSNTLSDDWCVQATCPGPGTFIDGLTNGPILSSTVWGVAPGLMIPTISNTTFTIDGELQIDNLITFNNCTLVVKPGGTITIMPAMVCSLTVNTVILGCPSMWVGIVMRTQAILYCNNSTIRDANKGITVGDRCRYYVEDSQILDCITGIYTSPIAGIYNILGHVYGTSFGLTLPQFKSSYIGQGPVGNVGRAGINFNDVILNVGDNTQAQNEFFNINYGVEIYNSTITVTNSHFEEMYPESIYFAAKQPRGGAILSITNKDRIHILRVQPALVNQMTIENANFGVHNNYTHTFVDDVRMTLVNTGISSVLNRFRTTQVRTCSINANGQPGSPSTIVRYGIDWLNNASSNLMLATLNTISVEGPTSIAVRLSEANTVISPNYNIIDNDITTLSAFGGIQANNVLQVRIQENNVSQEQLNSGSNFDAVGIQLNNCADSDINCNYVNNTNATALSTFGYVFNQSATNDINCNEAVGNEIGVFFGGAQCAGTFFRGNLMQDNPITGLNLNNTAIISQQPNAGNAPYFGNRWVGTFGSGYGAANLNAGSQPILWQSLFTTNQADPDHNPIIPPGNQPQFFGVDNTTWFIDQVSGTTFSCVDSNLCQVNLAGGGGDDEFRMRIAQDDSLTVEYIQESKAMAKQQLYADLQEDSLLLASDTIYQNFALSNQYLEIGYLYSTKEHFKGVANMSANDLEDLHVADSLIQSFVDSQYFLDSLNATNTSQLYMTQRETLLNQVISQQQIVTVLMNQQSTLDLLEFANATMSNNQVIATEIPHINEAFINEKEIVFHTLGIDSLLPDSTQLIQVAMQCPYAGGGSVYRARFLVNLFNKSIIFDDSNVCLQAGYFRQQKGSDETIKQIENISILPNPASTEVEIYLSGDNEGLCKLILYNAIGKQLSSQQFECIKKNHKLDISSYSPGIYNIAVQINNEEVRYHKLVIAR